MITTHIQPRSATLKIVNLRPSEDYKVQWEQVSQHEEAVNMSHRGMGGGGGNFGIGAVDNWLFHGLSSHFL